MNLIVDVASISCLKAREAHLNYLRMDRASLRASTHISPCVKRYKLRRAPHAIGRATGAHGTNMSQCAALAFQQTVDKTTACCL
jgi:hypothetical protein